MKTAILGLGVSGRACIDYLRGRGNIIVGVDSALPQIEGIPILSDREKPQLEGIELLVKSPGIPYTHPWVQAAQRLGIPIESEIDLALIELSKRGKTVLGITGSNGKTTTTLLAAHLLHLSGKKAVAAGNVGIPLITQIEADYDIFVVELSSFQLEQIKQRPFLDGALILNITPNHLNHHSTFETYREAKLRIATCLKEDARLYVTEQVIRTCGSFLSRESMKKVETFCSLGYRDRSYHLFPHDLENAAAALALTGVSLETFEEGITTFVRPPHRLEFVRDVAGICYINDSKATSVDAVIKAVQAVKGPIILIAGGVDKGGEFRDWLPYFREKVLRVLALGEAAGRIQRELGAEIRVDKVSSLEEGVRLAGASAGDTVLLSPGCSSYDMFKDYQHRGEVFRKIVEQIG